MVVAIKKRRDNARRSENLIVWLLVSRDCLRLVFALPLPVHKVKWQAVEYFALLRAAIRQVHIADQSGFADRGIALDADQGACTVVTEAADYTPRPGGYRFGCHGFLLQNYLYRLIQYYQHSTSGSIA
jgi:hypothetical protein